MTITVLHARVLSKAKLGDTHQLVTGEVMKIVIAWVLLLVGRGMQEMVRLSHIFAHLRAWDRGIVHDTIVTIISGTRRFTSCRLVQLLPHAVMDVSLRLLGAVESRTWLSLHLEGVDHWLDSSAEFGAFVSELWVFVLTRAGLFDATSLETFILCNRPVWCLAFIGNGLIVVIWSWDVAQTLVVDELSNYNHKGDIKVKDLIT